MYEREVALMFTKAMIIPTGDELAAGIVLDTDAPEIMKNLLAINGSAEVVRIAPVIDKEEAIVSKIKESAANGYDLIVLIGGSGGGHRFSTTLGKDYTHSSLDMILSDKQEGALYGKNGHMWSKLVIGKLGDTLVFNVPGPYEEATATIKAFKDSYKKDSHNLEEINKSMLEALKAKY
ncbi:MAG: molybdopterin-binding protein [Clostridiales bacterium]|nr:molybdopterin-binding protein [Clostridiales bacterium]